MSKKKLDCGHSDDWNRRVKENTCCRKCAAEIDKEELRHAKKHLGFMVKREDGWYYTNGFDTLTFKIYHWEGNHNWRGVTQHYGHFFFDGNWYLARMVTGGWNTFATAKKLKHFPYACRISTYGNNWYKRESTQKAFGIRE